MKGRANTGVHVTSATESHKVSEANEIRPRPRTMMCTANKGKAVDGKGNVVVNELDLNLNRLAYDQNGGDVIGLSVEAFASEGRASYSQHNAIDKKLSKEWTGRFDDFAASLGHQFKTAHTSSHEHVANIELDSEEGEPSKETDKKEVGAEYNDTFEGKFQTEESLLDDDDYVLVTLHKA